MQMGNDSNNSSSDSGSSSDDLSEYLQVFLDESAEELDSLVEAILLLEGDPQNANALNKAFRMLHSLKGSCGMMGFEVVGDFAHVLEDRFENYRSGNDVLDRDTATLVLQCIDYFRSFIARLRGGDSSEGDPAELVRQLHDLDKQNQQESTPAAPAPRVDNAMSPNTPMQVQLPAAVSISGGMLIRIKFKPGLQLADLKARLIVSRMASIGEVVACEPRMEDVHSFDELPLFALTLLTDRSLDEVRKIANVDGVESVDVEGSSMSGPVSEAVETNAAEQAESLRTPHVATEAPAAVLARASVEQDAAVQPASTTAETTEGKSQVNETLRIDIERLDRLMNLTGELVVTNARFAEITTQMSPVFRRNSVFNKSKDLTERLRQRFQQARQQFADSKLTDEIWSTVFDGVDDELDGLDEQSALWDEGHSRFLEITEAVDQLSLVSKNLQRGVLNTRMVPVGPLLNRFKRVIRDLSVERGKRVQLLIQGEKTELDRRMIDALGDPLLHLVRNSIDHGIEPPDRRRALGKPETGTIRLEATHRGNNVLITIRDDGGGIRTEKIRERVIARGLATDAQVSEMSEQQIIDFIWHPGFSTAEQVTDISGRGVGMDIVRSAISDLSGSIDVATVPGEGATFTIRLPLTLAIIRSLLVRFRDGFFSIPIDDVREIVLVSPDKLYAVHRHTTIDVRGELIPLVTMENVFDWHDDPNAKRADAAAASRNINVVVLQARGKTLGLRVDALVGRADIVIKSLTENFVAIRGISGASIMGDSTLR